MTKPDAEHRERYVAGIDEAGRGPLIGPLVYAIVAVPLSYQKRFESSHKVRDSKKLTKENRERLRAALTSDPKVRFQTDHPSPLGISAAMSAGFNLNLISHNAIIHLVECMRRQVSLTTVFVDTVGPESTLKQKLEARFPGIAFVVAKKADDLYKVVGAASIFAKTDRDEQVERLGDVGSGYPGDPRTKEYFNEMAEKNQLGKEIRYQWSTVKNKYQWKVGGNYRKSAGEYIY